MKYIFLLLFSLFLFSNTSHADSPFEGIRTLGVQDGGRIKPFDTFARESLQLIYGKSKLKDKEAIEVVFTWMLLPDVWAGMEIVQIDYRKLKEELDLPPKTKYFAPSQLMSHPKLPTLIQTVNNKQEVKERLNSYDLAIQKLSNQLSLFQAISAGIHPGFIPDPSAENEKWKTYEKFTEEERLAFNGITKSFVESIRKQEQGDTNAIGVSLTKAVKDFKKNYQSSAPVADIKTEVHYNKLHPFMWSWILYLIAVLLFYYAFLLKQQKVYLAGIAVMVIGFIMHTYGFGLRVFLTGRPPVSNMYETVIWVPWGAILFAFFFEWKKKSNFMLISAGIVAILCMIVADFAPNVLDPSLQPLEPVLRSNLWLTIHVLTITIAYGAFFLAFILGDIALVYILKGEKKHKDKIKDLSEAIYRSEKVGVVLLAAGTILGGVWADYSWGRFWGWDPKETWALIALLGYLALLHAKQGGHVRNAGMIAGSVVAFSLVIMAWYGVNYVLGAGLHSYGFGGGGLEYVAGFVGIHFVFVAFVMAARKKS